MSKIRIAVEKGYEGYSRAVNRIFYGKAPKERFLLLLKYTLCFLTAVFLSKTTLPYTEKSVGKPLADAFLCSCTGGSVFVYAGAVFGSVLTKTATFSRVFTLSAVLLFRLSVSFWTGEGGTGSRLNRSPLIKIGYSSFMALLQCLFHITEAGVYVGIWLNLLATALALPLLTLAFSFFFAGYPERSVQDGRLFERALYEASVLLFFMAVVFSLKSTRYFGISLSSLAALLLIFFCASKGGAMRGAAVGAVLGWVQNPALLLSYTAVGGSAGVFYCLGILPAAGVSAFVGACVAIFQVGFVSLVSFIPETVMAVAIASPMIRYSFIPERFPYPKGELPMEYGGIPEAEKRAILSVKKQEEILKLSETLREIAGVIDDGDFGDVGGVRGRICSALTDGFCDSCALNSICWESEREKTERSVWGIVKSVKNGDVQPLERSDGYLSGYCVKYKGLLDEIKGICSHITLPRTAVNVKNTEAEGLEVLADVLLDISDGINGESARNESVEKAVLVTAGAIGFDAKSISVLGNDRKRIYAYGVSENMTAEESERVRKAFSEACKTEYSAATSDPLSECVIFSPEKTLSTSVSFLKQTKEGESCSGDSVFTFETENGYFYALLADGMGSGEEARRVSSSALKILEKLLSCGIKKRKATVLIDSILRRKGGECFTTLDILEIDLVGGGASFLKNGAAASFVIRNGAVYTVSSQSMPIGIACGAESEERSFNLRKEDTVIMLSDGVLADDNVEKVISDIVCGGFSSVEELAERIMKKATDRECQSDDKTVVVIGINGYQESSGEKEA